MVTAVSEVSLVVEAHKEVDSSLSGGDASVEESVEDIVDFARVAVKSEVTDGPSVGVLTTLKTSAATESKRETSIYVVELNFNIPEVVITSEGALVDLVTISRDVEVLASPAHEVESEFKNNAGMSTKIKVSSKSAVIVEDSEYGNTIKSSGSVVTSRIVPLTEVEVSTDQVENKSRTVVSVLIDTITVAGIVSSIAINVAESLTIVLVSKKWAKPYGLCGEALILVADVNDTENSVEDTVSRILARAVSSVEEVHGVALVREEAEIADSPTLIR